MVQYALTWEQAGYFMRKVSDKLLLTIAILDQKVLNNISTEEYSNFDNVELSNRVASYNQESHDP